MLPRVVLLAAPPFACPNTLGRERTTDTSLRELHPQCLDVSLWRNRAASCRSEKDSLRLWLRRRPLESKTAKQRRGTSTISSEPKPLRTYRTNVMIFKCSLHLHQILRERPNSTARYRGVHVGHVIHVSEKSPLLFRHRYLQQFSRRYQVTNDVLQ